MAIEVATSVPAGIFQGNTATWLQSSQDYPPSDAWVLSYVFTSALNSFSISGGDITDDGANTFTILLPAATTAGYLAAVYSWVALVSKGVDRHAIARGRWCVEPDPAAATAIEARTHAEIMVAALEALIQGRATSDQQSYTIQGTSVSRLSPAELEEWRDKYRSEVNQAQASEALAAGRTANKSIRMKL